MKDLNAYASNDYTHKINKNFQRQVVNILLHIIFTKCFGAQKNRLNETFF